MLPSNFYTDLAKAIRQLNVAVTASLERATPKNEMPDRRRLSATLTSLYKKINTIIDEFSLGSMSTLIQRAHALKPDDAGLRLTRSANLLFKLQEYAQWQNNLLSGEKYDDAIKNEADLFVRLSLKDLTVSCLLIKVASKKIN